MEKTLNVRGEAALYVDPDKTIVAMHLEDTKEAYEDCLTLSDAKTNLLKSALSDAGFASEQIKTTAFCLAPAYESKKVGNIYQSIQVGYTFKHDLKIEFPMDAQLLKNVLETLKSCSVDVAFRISYGLWSEEEAMDKAIYLAVQDAKHKAKILAKAAEITLGDIEHIDYEEESDILCNAVYAKTVNENEGMNAEPIEIRTEVLISWRIK